MGWFAHEISVFFFTLEEFKLFLINVIHAVESI